VIAKETDDLVKLKIKDLDEWELVYDRVLIKDNQEVSPEGLLILGSEVDKNASATKTGTVIAVGIGERNKNGDLIPLDVKVGDTVLYSAYQGRPVHIEEEAFTLIRECDLMLALDAE